MSDANDSNVTGSMTTLRTFSSSYRLAPGISRVESVSNADYSQSRQFIAVNGSLTPGDKARIATSTSWFI